MNFKYFYIGQLFEVLAFVVSIIYYKRTKGSFLQWMSLYLFYTVFSENLGSYVHYALNKPTTPIFLWYNAITILFYTFIFSKLLIGKAILKKGLWIFSSILSTSLICLFLFVNNYVEYKFQLQIVFGFYISIVACYYLYTEFMNDDLEEFLINKSGFWIATGVLLFYSGYSIVLTLHPVTSKNKIFILGISIHNFFAQVLSVFLYTCLAIALIVWKPKTTKSLSQ